MTVKFSFILFEIDKKNYTKENARQPLKIDLHKLVILLIKNQSCLGLRFWLITTRNAIYKFKLHKIIKF